MLGPLSRHSEPDAYDLCGEHAARMTAPRGWELLRVAGGEDVTDDLVALAEAVRPRSAQSPSAAPTAPAAQPPRDRRAPAGSAAPPARHLHVVRTTNE